MHCNKCGEKILANSKFCNICGAKIALVNDCENTCTEDYSKSGFIGTSDGSKCVTEDLIEDYVEQDFPQNEVKTNQSEKPIKVKKLSKKQITIFSSLIIGAIFLITMLSVYRWINGPDKILEKFKSSITNEDYNLLKDIVITTDSRITIDEESLKPFVKSFKQKPSLLNQVVAELNSDIVKENNDTQFQKGDTVNSRLIKLYSKERFLIGPKYYILIEPVYVNVDIAQGDVVVSLDDKEMLTTNQGNKSYEIGPFLPGEYTLSAQGKSYDNSARDSMFLSYLNEIKTSTTRASLLAEYKNLNIRSNMQDAVIFLNGVDTGIKVSDYTKLGLVKEGTEIAAVLTNSNGTFKTGNFSVVGSDINLYFENLNKITNAPDKNASTSALESKVYDTVNNYLNNFDDAVNYNYFSSIKQYMKYNSDIYNTQMKYISEQYKLGTRLYFIDFNATDYNFSSDKSSGTVKVTETFKVNNKKGEESNLTLTWIYGFSYNSINDSYQLTSMTAE